MKVVCINNNGWYAFENTYCMYLSPGYFSETHAVRYREEYEVTGSFVGELPTHAKGDGMGFKRTIK